MKKDKTHSNRVYKLIIILLLIIMGYIYVNIMTLSKTAKDYEKHKQFENEQMQMIEYVCEHKEGIKSFGQLVLNNEGSIQKLEENDLSHFSAPNGSYIDVINEFTVIYRYKTNTDWTNKTDQCYEFLYIDEINGENCDFLKDKDYLKIDDNIFVMPYVNEVIPLV